MNKIKLAELLETYDSSSQMSWEWLKDYYLIVQRPRMAKLMSSIKLDGVQTPIVLDDESMTVFDGQHRIVAAIELGLDELPWIPSSEWDE